MPTTCRARTERCSSLHSSRSVYRPTHSPRCWRRSGLVRLVGDELSVADIGLRLTYSRVSACFAAPTPDICRRQTRASSSFGHSHCALHLNPAEKVLAPAACGSTRTAIAEAHTAVYVAIGYRLAAPRRHPIGFSLRLPNAQSSLFRNACAEPVAHSPPSIGWFFIPIPCKPNALAALGVVGGMSLLEVLHYAHRTPSASPPFEHSPTSPNHEITTSGLAVISSAIVGKPTILKSGSQSAPRKPPLRSRFLVTHWRFYRTSPCIFRSAETEVAVLLRRARGGCLRRNKGVRFFLTPLNPQQIAVKQRFVYFRQVNRCGQFMPRPKSRLKILRVTY